ncbi:integrator complex subunit 12 [Drosophila tropicalis]|uniref:integrator complex subunit 12 n=1 Tax=Drosophila tropicalis TaxID=46794 RepID=UPI0035ABB360
MAANIAAAAAAAQEVDPVLKKAVKLLHSSNSTSASELRLLLDEALKVRFGPDKVITNNMSQRMMDDEANFPGRVATPPQPICTDEIINLTNSPDKDSVDTIGDSDDGLSAGIVNTGDTGDFGDLNCCVCGEMVFTATNRLIECSKCGAMYHQECHKPPITKEEAADDQEQTWQCDTCQNKPTTSRAATSFSVASASSTVFIADDPVPLTSKRSKSSAAGGSSHSSTSSNSSSPFYRPEPSSSTNASSSSSSKHCHKSSSSSSSKSHKEERSSKSTLGPSLSAFSTLEKPSASGSATSSSRRGSSKSSSSKSSSSKHHESSSSSSRRRSKQ